METHNTAVSQPIIEDNGSAYFLICSPIINYSKELSGVLVTSFDYYVINNLVNNIKFSENGKAVITSYSIHYTKLYEGKY